MAVEAAVNIQAELERWGWEPMLRASQAQRPDHPWMRQPPDEPAGPITGVPSHMSREARTDTCDLVGDPAGRPAGRPPLGWVWPCPVCETKLVLYAANSMGEAICYVCCEAHLTAKFGLSHYGRPQDRNRAVKPGRKAQTAA